MKQFIIRNLCRIYMWINVYFASYEQKIKIGHTINRWQWPFKYFKSWYLSLPNYHPKTGLTKYNFHYKVFHYLKSKISEYDSLYYHNVIFRNSMTPEKFHYWFHHIHNQPMTENEKKVLKALFDKEKTALN